MILSDSLHPFRWKQRGEYATDEEVRAVWAAVVARYALWCLHTFGGIAASEHCRIHIVNNL